MDKYEETGQIAFRSEKKLLPNAISEKRELTGDALSCTITHANHGKPAEQWMHENVGNNAKDPKIKDLATVVKGKTWEELVGFAISQKRNDILEFVRDQAKKNGVDLNWKEFLEHSKTEYERIHGTAKKLAMDSPPAVTQNNANALKQECDGIKKETGVDLTVLAFSLAGDLATSNKRREEIVYAAREVGVSTPNLHGIAKYLDTIYGTSLASQFTPKISPLIRNQALNLNVATAIQRDILWSESRTINITSIV